MIILCRCQKHKKKKTKKVKKEKKEKKQRRERQAEYEIAEGITTPSKETIPTPSQPTPSTNKLPVSYSLAPHIVY